MAKPRKTMRVRIPKYVTPRNKWRRAIQGKVRAEQRRRGIAYDRSDRLELRVRLYFKGPALFFHDVDNRLKDILDALQGRIGGPKLIKPRRPVIQNDSQVWRVVAEKSAPPPQSHGHGHLTVRLHRPR